MFKHFHFQDTVVSSVTTGPLAVETLYGCTFLFSSLYAVIAFLYWILCSLSPDRARRSTSHARSASFTLLASCNFSATHFSSICLCSCSLSSLLQENNEFYLSVNVRRCVYCVFCASAQESIHTCTCILLFHCCFHKMVFATLDDT